MSAYVTFLSTKCGQALLDATENIRLTSVSV